MGKGGGKPGMEKGCVTELLHEKRERRHRGGAGPPPGGNSGSIWFNLAQLGSGCGGKQALRGGVGTVLGADAKDLTDARLFLLSR